MGRVLEFHVFSLDSSTELWGSKLSFQLSISMPMIVSYVRAHVRAHVHV